MNQLRSMRQFRDLSEDKIEAMAVERIRSGRTSGRRPQGPEDASSGAVRLEYLGMYHRDEGVPLFEEPWWISAYADPEPGVDDDKSALPHRAYPVYVLRHGGKRYVCLAVDWEPA